MGYATDAKTFKMGKYLQMEIVKCLKIVILKMTILFLYEEKSFSF